MISLNEQITEYLTYCECRKRLDPKTLKAYRIDLKQYELGLLMDKNGIPLVFDLFPGNGYTHKSRIHPKKIQVNVTVPGQKKKKKKSVSIDQKQMAYYSEKYAKKQKYDRDIMVARAKNLIAHPKKYDKVTAAESGAYVQNIAFDKSTGEIVEGREVVLDEAKIAEEEKYDGYYSIVTSELKMSDQEIRGTYRGLARMEETFKISKTEFESRPVFVWTNGHIEGHFATCFTALVLIRLLQAKLGSKYPVGKMIKSLRKYNCTQIDNTCFITFSWSALFSML